MQSHSQNTAPVTASDIEWHNARLAVLRTAVPPASEWKHHYYGGSEAPPVIDDADWAQRTSSSLLFTDSATMADHIAVLRDAGVRNVVPWMGVGGVPQHHVLRFMRLFAEHVMPKFTG